MDLESLYKSQRSSENELESKQRLLKPKNAVLNTSGKKLTSFARKRLNTEVKELKEGVKAIQSEIRRIEKLLTSIYRGIDDKISRSNVKKAAKNESYHERYGKSIKDRLDTFLTKMPDEKVMQLKAELPKAEFKAGNAMMMKALVSAPRFLHTRVVSNPTAREEYLSHFRGKLTGVKAKSRKK